MVGVGSAGPDLKPATFDPFWGFNHFAATHIRMGWHSNGNKPLDFEVITFACNPPCFQKPTCKKVKHFARKLSEKWAGSSVLEIILGCPVLGCPILRDPTYAYYAYLRYVYLSLILYNYIYIFN
jgi:hypothetical protein